jgi:hypothetical protein
MKSIVENSASDTTFLEKRINEGSITNVMMFQALRRGAYELEAVRDERGCTESFVIISFRGGLVGSSTTTNKMADDGGEMARVSACINSSSGVIQGTRKGIGAARGPMV